MFINKFHHSRHLEPTLRSILNPLSSPFRIRSHHTKMLRDKTQNQYKVKKRNYKYHTIADICLSAIHVCIKKMNGRIYLKRLIWTRFEGEKAFEALPLSYFDDTCQESLKSFINSCNTLEYFGWELSKEKSCIDFINNNFITIRPRGTWVLDHTNRRFKTWSAIIPEPETEQTETEPEDYQLIDQR